MLKIMVPYILVLLQLSGAQTGSNMTQKDKDLLEAVRSGNTTEIVRLLKDGANVNAKDIHSVTPLHIASARGDCNTMELLIKNGAQVGTKDDSNDTSLHDAAMNGKIEAAKLLIEKGADVNSKNIIGKTPIYSAAESGNLNLVKFLANKGAKIPTTGFTPLHSAVEGYYHSQKVEAQFKEMIDYFLSQGVDINAKGNSGYSGADVTVLHSAAVNADKEIIELLIEKGAQVDARAKTGRTPLFIAAMAGNKGAAEALLTKGANVNARDDSNDTPLHSAVMENNLVRPAGSTKARIEFVELLLANGADVNARDNRQYTPLHNAVGWGWFKQVFTNASEYKVAYKAIIQALLEKGADPNIKDRSGRTPLTLAEGEPEIIELLIKYGAKK
jgi:ankyrin repeat protein